MRLIFLVPNNFFTKKYYDDLYVDKISKYFEVELWCTIKLSSDRYDKLKNQRMSHKIEGVVYIDSIEEMDNRFLSEKDIVDIYKDGLTNHIRSIAEVFYGDSNFINKAKKLLKTNIYCRELAWKLKHRKLYKIDYCLTPPKLKYRPAYKYISIHHVKYDSYLDSLKEPPHLKEKYILFLDSNLPFLSDILITRKEESIEPKKYYKLLNDFFNYVERKYGYNVVIAAHPKAEYSDKIFRGRKIIKYKTANLIQNAEFVLTHDTNSNINAVLCHKPLVFLYYKEMLEKGSRPCAIATMEYSRLLKAPLVNIEDDYSLTIDLNKRAYKKFIESFIINKKRANKTNEELLVEFLKEIK